MPKMHPDWTVICRNVTSPWMALAFAMSSDEERRELSRTWPGTMTVVPRPHGVPLSVIRAEVEAIKAHNPRFEPNGPITQVLAARGISVINLSGDRNESAPEMREHDIRLAEREMSAAFSRATDGDDLPDRPRVIRVAERFFAIVCHQLTMSSPGMRGGNVYGLVPLEYLDLRA